MRWLNKVKQGIQEKQQKQVYERFKTAGLARQCMVCRFFTYRQEKPRNWVCRCPDERLTFKGNTCLGWDFGEHPEMVVMNSR